MKLIGEINEKIYRLLLLIIGIIFGCLTLRIIFDNISYFGKINTVVCIIGIILYLLFLFTMYVLIGKCIKNITKKREIIILLIFFIIFLCIQIIFGISLRVTPSWDFGAVYDSAVSYATKGTFGGLDYYSLFPNNIALLFILSSFFKIASFIGITNFYFVGLFLNVISIDISILLLYFVIRKKINIKSALFTLVVCSTVLAFFTYTPIYYSDTMSLPYITGMIYIIECIDVDKFNKKPFLKVSYYLLASLTCFIGYMLKMTAIICLAGIIIYHLLCDNEFLKKNVKKFSIIIVIILLMSIIFKLTITKNIEEKTNVEKIPYTHWIMMGMNSTTMGIYSGDDYNLITYSVPTTAERQKINIVEIKKRLKAFGYIGYIKFLADKASITWGDGTYFAPEKLRREVVNYTTLHDYVLTNGEHFNLYYTFSQVVHFTIMIFMTISVAILFKRKEYNFLFSILLSIFGLFIFLLIWETRSRYLINFIPLFIILAVFGFKSVFEYILKRVNYSNNKNVISKEK